MEIIGRRSELAAVRRLLDRADAGAGGSLVFTGPPGSGKSALLDAAARLAGERGFRVVRVATAGVDTEDRFWRRVVGADTAEVDGRTAPSLDDAVAAFFRGGRLLLVVDDVDRIGAAASAVPAAIEARAAGAIAMVATARRSVGSAPHMRLRALAERELAVLIPGYSADVLHEVWLASGGWPGTALRLVFGSGYEGADESAGEPAGESVDEPVGERSDDQQDDQQDHRPDDRSGEPVGETIARLALAAPSQAQFLELDVALLRLLEAAAVGTRTPSTRARVLGRLARELLGEPSAAARRRALADEAEKLARETGEPGVIAEVLDSRLHALWDPAAAQERLSVASQIAQLAWRAGDSALERRGLFWRFIALAELGDLPAAEAALGVYGRAADLAGDEAAQAVVVARQAMLAAVRGRFDAADALVARFTERADQIGLPDAERLAATLRAALGALRGAGEALARGWQEQARRLPGHFFEANAARALAESGHGAEAALELERMLPAVREGSGPRWLAVTADLALAASVVGETGAVRDLYDALLPYQGRLVVWGGANMITGPVDDYLGRLSLRLGDAECAVQHLDRAVDLEERTGTLPWLAATLRVRGSALAARGGTQDAARSQADLARARLLAERLGMKGLLAAFDPPGDAWRLRREGTDWILEAGPESARLGDRRGLHYLRALIASPGQEIAALDLVSGGAGLLAPAPVPVLDDAARAAYRQRLSALSDELDAADRAGDVERAAAVHAERVALTEELRRASALGGRPRALGDEAERARVNVTRALWAAVRQIESAAPLAGAHLRASLRTGGFLRYQPGPGGPARWTV